MGRERRASSVVAAVAAAVVSGPSPLNASSDSVTNVNSYIEPTCFYTNATTNIISDVSGWFRAASGLTTLTPVREFDTRDGSGGVPVGPRAAGSTLTFEVAGVNGLPASGIGAVVLNVTAENAGEPGYATVFPCGADPLTSNPNDVVDQTVAGLVVAPVSPEGTVCFSTSGTTQLIADVSAWSPTASELHPLNPARVFDTRDGLGGVGALPLTAGSHLEFTVAGENGVPVTGAGAVILNVTATKATGAGHITVYPCGNRPLTSNVNDVDADPVPNTVIAPVSKDGTVCFYTNKKTDLVVDVSGWFDGPGI